MFGSPERLSASTSPIAPAAFARCALTTKAQSPRVASAIAPRSEPAGRGERPPFAFPGGPQRLRGVGVPATDTTEPTSTSSWSRSPQAAGAGPPAPATNGICLSASGASAAVSASAGAKKWVFERAATEIESGAVPGEPAEPSP